MIDWWRRRESWSKGNVAKGRINVKQYNRKSSNILRIESTPPLGYIHTYVYIHTCMHAHICVRIPFILLTLI